MSFMLLQKDMIRCWRKITISSQMVIYFSAMYQADPLLDQDKPMFEEETDSEIDLK